jgi:hypothetical protein
VTDALVEHVPVELLLKFRAVVGLHAVDAKGLAFADVVEELDGGTLVVALEYLEDPKSGAVVDGGVLVVALRGHAGNRSHEFQVDLDLVARLGHLVALPTFCVGLVALRARPVEPGLLQDPPDPRVRHLDVVIARQVHGDLLGAEVIVLTQVEDPGHDLVTGRRWAVNRTPRALSKAGFTLGDVTLEPAVVTASADAVVAADLLHVVRDLLSVTDHRQTSPGSSLELTFGHGSSFSEEPSVPDVRQFFIPETMEPQTPSPTKSAQVRGGDLTLHLN